MASRLIINADDFGLTGGVNRAIADLYRAGVLTSATLMATGAAFEDAVSIVRANAGLGVGCHVVLTDGSPVSEPQSIPTLLGADGRTFRPSLGDFVQALLRGAIREDEIEREAMAQVRKVQRAGIAVTHLDTHKHTHVFPAVVRPLLRVAERMAVGAIRRPFEPAWSVALGHGRRLRRLQMRILSGLEAKFDRNPEIRDARVLTTDGSVGISTTGSLTASTLRELLESLPREGSFELCCHPGYHDGELDGIPTRLRHHREVERMALLAEVPGFISKPNAPELINYSKLGYLNLEYSNPAAFGGRGL